MSESESQFDNFEDAATADLVGAGDDPVDPKWPIVNVTNVNPHLPALDANKVQLLFWQLAVLVCLSALGLGVTASAAFLAIW